MPASNNQTTALAPLAKDVTLSDLVTEEWNAHDLWALKNTIAKECDLPQLRVFIGAAKRLGLDPLARQIVPIVQGGRMTPQVTIDGFRLIAERTGKYAGQLGPFWCDASGEWREVWTSDTAPAACKVGVIRRDFEQPMWGVARTKAYAKGGQWATMPDVMIAKVAESLALRKAFPQELAGAYTEDEMAQAEPENARTVVAAASSVQVVTNATGQRVDSATGEILPAKVKQTTRTASVQEVPASPAPTHHADHKAPVDPWAEVRELTSQLALSDPERAAIFNRTVPPKKDGGRHSLAHRDAVLAELRKRYAKETDQQPEPEEADDGDMVFAVEGEEEETPNFNPPAALGAAQVPDAYDLRKLDFANH